jgi:peptide/nickel transport system permease protein
MTGLLAYGVRRVLFAVILVFLVSSSGLILARLAPGDFTSTLVGGNLSIKTLAQERQRLGLDRPIGEHYLAWLGRAARLDFGASILYGRPVGTLVRERAANTLVLALAALALATLVGVPLGVYSGASPPGALRSLIQAVAVAGVSLPPLLTSLAFVLLAARTGWFPIGGMPAFADGSRDAWAMLGDLIWHVTLPAVAIAIPIAATLERLQSQAIAETLGMPFIVAAAARGIPRTRILWRHALRTAIRPVAAVYGILAGSLLSGSFAVEIVMSWPGLGRLLYEALVARDVYLVAGCSAAGAVFLAAGSLLSDLALAVADPRVRDGG